MSDGNEHHLLQGVSRSFFLSLRLLPRPMRRAAGLGYLLARTSDTLADSAGVDATTRLAALDAFGQRVAGGTPPLIWPRALRDGVGDPMERVLLEHSERLVGELDALPDDEARLVREVTATILGGQRLDLERFGAASATRPVALADAAQLEDYAWRVAGCVGAFWTRLGFLTLGPRFSMAPEATLVARGIAYGKGLQVVNILRDLPQDLAAGRCYLPVADPSDRAAILACHAAWIRRAGEWVDEGLAYAAVLPDRRLRAASALPAMLAHETLARLAKADWEGLCRRVKVPRRRVYLALLRAWIRRRGLAEH